MNGSQGGAYRARLSIGFRLASSTETPRSRASAETLATLYAQDPSTVADAYDLATKARKTLPDDPQLSELLGRLSYEKKEYPRAIQLFQETARKRPLDVDSLLYLGMSQLQASQKAEERGALNQALAGGLQEPARQRSETRPRGSPAGVNRLLGLKLGAQAGEGAQPSWLWGPAGILPAATDRC